MALGSTYNDMIIKGSGLATWNWTPAALFLFFVLVAIINVLLQVIERTPAAGSQHHYAATHLRPATWMTVIGFTALHQTRWSHPRQSPIAG